MTTTMPTVFSRLDSHEAEDEREMWICRFDRDEVGGWGMHHHRQHQINWVSEGVLTCVVDDRSWVLPANRAMFVPAGRSHDVILHPPAHLHSVHVWPAVCPLGWTEPTVFAVSPLLRELTLTLAGDGLDVEVLAPARSLYFGLVQSLADPGVAVPMPADPVARLVAEHLVAWPADPHTLEEWAPQVGASVSSLRRAFRSGTGMTFTAWRTQVRLRAALPLLAQGVPVAAVAGRVGYTSPTGFIEAFRRHFGETPAAHFRGCRDEVAPLAV